MSKIIKNIIPLIFSILFINFASFLDIDAKELDYNAKKKLQIEKIANTKILSQKRLEIDTLKKLMIDEEPSELLNILLKIETEVSNTDDKLSFYLIQEIISQVYKEIGALDKSLQYVEPFLLYLRKYHPEKIQGYDLIKVGNIFFEQKNLAVAEQYYREAKNKFEEIQDLHGIALSINNIALTFDKAGNYEKAYQYFLEAKKVRIKFGNVHLIAHSYYYLAKNRLKSKDIKQAYIYITQAYQSFNSIPQADEFLDKEYVLILDIYARVLLELNKKEKAIEILNEMKIYGSKNKVKISELISHSIFLFMYSHNSPNIDSVNSYTQILIKSSKDFGSLLYEYEAYKEIYEAYEKLKEWEKANYYKGEFLKLQDSIFSLNVNNISSKLIILNTLQQKDLELEILNKENERNQLLWLIALITLIAPITFLFWKSKLQQKNKLLLENQVLERTNELMKVRDYLQEEVEIRKQTEIKLNEALIKEQKFSDMKSQFVNSMSHEFRTPLTAIMSKTQVLQMKLDYNKNITNEELKAALQSIFEYSQSIKKMIDNLAGLTSIQFEISQAKIQTISLNSYFNLLSNHLAKKNKLNNVEISFEQNEYEILANEMLINFAIDELVDNAISYGEKDKTVEIFFTKSEDYISICVKNFGKNIDETTNNDLFNLFTRGEKVENYNENRGLGIGLSIVKMCCDAMGAKVFIENFEEGVIFSLNFNVNIEQ